MSLLDQTILPIPKHVRTVFGPAGSAKADIECYEEILRLMRDGFKLDNASRMAADAYGVHFNTAKNIFYRYRAQNA